MAPRVVVLFRTYEWDEFARRAATRLCEQAAGMDFFVLADETGRKPIDTGHLRKLAHKQADFPPLGLPCRAPPDTNPLWWNCDYGVYDAVLKHPEYDYYLVVEDDVAVNVPLRELVSAMAAAGHEALVSMGPRPIGAWRHAWSCRDLPYHDGCWSTLSTLFLSRGAALFLLAERRRLATIPLRAWPFCEGFVASALAHGGYTTTQLGEHGDVTHFGSQLLFLESDTRVWRPGCFAHAVLGQERFVRKFRERAFEQMLESGRYRELAIARDGLSRLGVTAFEGWRIRPAAGNLALGKHARQSSLHRLSRPAREPRLDPNELDARGANCGVLTGRGGFRTEFQEEPWWEVDLGASHTVRAVRLFNSAHCPERARRLRLAISEDRAAWRTVFRKDNDRVFAGVNDPLLCRFPEAAHARYVRVVLEARTHLHLDEVEVFGRREVT